MPKMNYNIVREHCTDASRHIAPCSNSCQLHALLQKKSQKVDHKDQALKTPDCVQCPSCDHREPIKPAAEPEALDQSSGKSFRVKRTVSLLNGLYLYSALKSQPPSPTHTHSHTGANLSPPTVMWCHGQGQMTGHQTCDLPLWRGEVVRGGPQLPRHWACICRLPLTVIHTSEPLHSHGPTRF